MQDHVPISIDQIWTRKVSGRSCKVIEVNNSSVKIKHEKGRITIKSIKYFKLKYNLSADQKDSLLLDINKRRCIYCEDLKTVDQFSLKNKNKGTLSSICKPCKSKATVDRRNYDKDSMAKRAHIVSLYRDRHRDKVRERGRKQSANYRETLDKAYIRNLFYKQGVPFNEIPEEIIILKQIQIKLKRKIDEKVNKY